MKKPGKRPAPSKTRKPAAGPGEVNPFLDLLQQAEPDLLQALDDWRQFLHLLQCCSELLV